MGFFDFLKKNENEQIKENKSIDQVLNEIQEEYGYIDDIEENEENIEQEECIESEEYEEYEDQEINIELEDIRKNIEALQGDLAKDLDIICLKVLCSNSENNKNIMAIKEIKKRLLEKYSEEEIDKLFSKKTNLNLSFQEIINILETSYSTDSEMIIIKALLDTPENYEREKSIFYSLKKMQEKYPFDVNIQNCLFKIDSNYSNYFTLAEKLMPLLGGRKNIIAVDSCITRLNLEVKDISLVDDTKIKKIVPGVLKSSKTRVQVIVGPRVNFVAGAIKEML